MDAPFYLAIGSCIVEPGDGSADYHVTSMSFPEPEPDGFGGHVPAVRGITLTVEGTSVADLSANIAALRRECVRGNLVYFKPSLTGSTLECRIREARVVEDNYDPLRRSTSGTQKAFLSVTLTTDPYWLGVWGADVTPTVTTVPGHFDVSAPAGEVDALMRIRCIADDNGTVLAIGVKPDPGAGYDYVDDYGTSDDTSDANALGTYKVGEVVDSSLTGNEIGTAPNIDTNDNRGRHLVIARLDSTATTASSNTAQVATTTTGNAISESVTVYESAIAFTSNDLIGRELGDVQIPAGQVPDMETGSGWAAEGALVTQNVDDGTKTLTSASQGVGQAIAALQTFTVAQTSRVTAFTYTVDVEPNTTVNDSAISLVQMSGSDIVADLGQEYGPTLTAGTHKLSLSIPVDVVPGVTYGLYLQVETLSASAFTIGVAASNGNYANGALTTPLGSGESAGDDLTFTVHGQLPLGFNTTNPVRAACSESSKTIALDYVQRIPVDYAALIYRKASGSLALYYDGDTDTPYIADADGIGPAVYDKTEVRAPLRVKPGVTNRVVLGVAQADEVVGGATVTYAIRPRYLTATG